MPNDAYGRVDTDALNEVHAFIERYGTHDQQYAVLLATLVGQAKAMGIPLKQVGYDLQANWNSFGQPSIVSEH